LSYRFRGQFDITGRVRQMKRGDMEIPELHPWPKGQSEALRIQQSLGPQVVTSGSLEAVEFIAGVDTAFDHIENVLFAGVSLFSYPELIECERATASATALFPYVPGLHAFREGPVILKGLAQLRTPPDVIIFAAHGLAHPRSFGLASHLGLILDIPSIGCARKRLVGQHDEVGPQRGASQRLIVDNKEVGRVYRTRENVKPVFISPGHKCGINEAVEMVIKCLRDYRVPEPLRSAHRLANRAKRNHKNAT